MCGYMLPNEITICGMRYKVVERNFVCKEELRNAEIDLFNGEIIIDSTMTNDRKKVAFIHEVIHGICDATGLFEVGENESAVQALASGLYSTFKGTTIFS